MSLVDLLAGVEAHEKTLTVVDAPAHVADTLTERFADRNLSVRRATASGGPDGYVVLSQGDDFLTAIAVDDLLAEESGTDPGFERSSYDRILGHLDETLFTSYEPDRMLAASREIEDRAWRLGTGELHAGFQTLSNFAQQTTPYERLGGRGTLSVHAYAAPEGGRPAVDDVTLHVEDAPELRDTWFVVYDGGGIDVNKCALVAEEREPGRFYGFWTYDADSVDSALDHLTRTYAAARTEGGESDAHAG